MTNFEIFLIHVFNYQNSSKSNHNWTKTLSENFEDVDPELFSKLRTENNLFML